jgi:hypothetical protein
MVHLKEKFADHEGLHHASNECDFREIGKETAGDFPWCSRREQGGTSLMTTGTESLD